jgi:hypothetical protein
MKQALVQLRFIAEQKQTFRIRIETANRVNLFWKSKLRQRAIGRTIRCELRKDAVGFVEGEEHREERCRPD